MLRLLTIFLFITFLYPPFSAIAENAASPSSEWIVDTDLAPDDALALLYLLNHPGVKIKAITLEMTGYLSCQQASRRTEILLKLTRQRDIPVGCGRDKPLNAAHRFPALEKMSYDSWPHTYLLPPSSTEKKPQNAKNIIIKILNNAQQPINILAIGPLTTLAEVFEERPLLKKKIRALYVMGGAIKVKGNVQDVLAKSRNNRAELNFYLDPDAAGKVFQSGVTLTLVPLDLTNSVSMNASLYQKLKGKHPAAAAQFATAMVEQDTQRLTSGYLWDPITAVIALNEGLATFEVLRLYVKQTPEALAGTTTLDPVKGSRIRVSQSLRAEELIQEFLDGLNALNDTRR